MTDPLCTVTNYAHLLHPKWPWSFNRASSWHVVFCRPPNMQIMFSSIHQPRCTLCLNCVRWRLITLTWYQKVTHRVPTLLLTKKSRTFPWPH